MWDIVLWVAGFVISGVFGLIGWVINMILSKIKDVEDNHQLLVKGLSDHKLHAAETFATRIDVEKGFDRVMDKLDNIDEKLDRKVDK